LQPTYWWFHSFIKRSLFTALLRAACYYHPAAGFERLYLVSFIFKIPNMLWICSWKDIQDSLEKSKGSILWTLAGMSSFIESRKQK